MTSTICVECYNKIKTKDCQPCKCECGDGTKYAFTQSENKCPRRSSDEVPCECKDSYGRIREDATYKDVTSQDSKAASCIGS